MGNEDDFVGSIGEHAADHRISFGEVDADEATFAGGVGVGGQGGLLNLAGLGGHDQEVVFVELGMREHGRDLFAFIEGEERFDGLAFGDAAAFGDLVDLFGHTLAVGGDEQDIVVGLGSEEMLHKILFVSIGADDAFAAAFLRAEIGHAGAFDEPEVRDCDDHAFIRDDIFHPEFANGVADFGFTRGGVFLPGGDELFFDDVEEETLGSEDGAESFDELHESLVFFFDLFAFESGELVETKLENGVGLFL